MHESENRFKCVLIESTENGGVRELHINADHVISVQTTTFPQGSGLRDELLVKFVDGSEWSRSDRAPEKTGDTRSAYALAKTITEKPARQFREEHEHES